MDSNFLPVGNVGAIPYLPIPVGNVGALGAGFLRRSGRRAGRDFQQATRQQDIIMEQQREMEQALQQQRMQQSYMAQLQNQYNLAQSPGVMPIQSPYAANIPGGNPFSPTPASPPVTPPANARPVPLGAPAAVQMAAFAAATPGTATLTFTSQDPFWLYDLYIQCETQNLAYVESLTLGSQSIRAGNGGIQGVTYWSEANFNQGKLQGYFINSTQSLVVVVRNLSLATNWTMGTCSGASVR